MTRMISFRRYGRWSFDRMWHRTSIGPAGARLTLVPHAIRPISLVRGTTSDRKGVRVDEANWRDAQDQAARSGEGRVAVPNDRCGLQSVAAPENAKGRSITRLAKTALFNTRSGPSVLGTIPFTSSQAVLAACAPPVMAYFNEFLERQGAGELIARKFAVLC